MGGEESSFYSQSSYLLCSFDFFNLKLLTKEYFSIFKKKNLLNMNILISELQEPLLTALMTCVFQMKLS